MNTENPKADTRLPEETLTEVAGGQIDPGTNGKWEAPCFDCDAINDPCYVSIQDSTVYCTYRCYRCGNVYYQTFDA